MGEKLLPKRPYLYAVNDSRIEDLILDPHFKVTEEGEIYSLFDRGGYLRNSWRRCDWLQKVSGYRRLWYKTLKLSAHRVIYRKFKGPLDPYLHVNHIDGNRQNNRIENLELITPAENLLHSFRELGRKPNIGRSKISEADARDIRRLYAAGHSQVEIALKYGLAKSTVCYVVNGKTWRGRE